MNSWIAALSRVLQDPRVTAMGPDLLLKSCVVLLAAGGVCLCWRRGAGSARHLVWSLALAGCLCLPALSFLLPAWESPLWRVGTRAGSDNELTLTLDLAPAKARPVMGSRAPSAPAAAVALAGEADQPAGQRLTTHFRAGWAATCLMVWCGGTVLCLLWFAAGTLRLRAIRRAAQPPSDPDWFPLLRRLREDLGVARHVTLLQSAGDVMPVTWGWWRPVILLPAGAGAWSPDRRRVVLLHELAHVKRWDCLTQSIAQLACAVYWFNPLAWVAARRMCVERELACDDLVVNGGGKASDYAAHLLEVARAFRALPRVPAIGMARSSRLSGRVAAIVDSSRVRRAPRAWVLGLSAAGALGLVVTVAAQKPQAAAAPPPSATRPWFDERLRAFFAAKAAQARQLAAKATEPVAPDAWPYFEAGIKGDWQTATNLWSAMRGRAHQYEGTTPDATLDRVWGPILETELAWEQFANWREKYVLAYGNDIIKSVPPGSIYFGGTDPGRGVITAMSASHAEGKPFFTITQNALADRTYLEYLRRMYGAALYIPSDQDSQGCFNEYMADAKARLAEGKLKPGEDVRTVDNKVQVSGQVAVMSINGLLAKTIFEHNTNREFYVEESFPLDWMYPYLSPNGLIMKVNRQPLARLSDNQLRADHAYWAGYVAPLLGDWLRDGTSVPEVAAFVEKVYLKHDLGGFTGDPGFLEDTWARKSFSKLRSSIGGVYAWRLSPHCPVEYQPRNDADRQALLREAETAFRQALALCPDSPEAVLRYVQILLQFNRAEDARVIAETWLKLDPGNTMAAGLLDNLKKLERDQPPKRPSS